MHQMLRQNQVRAQDVKPYLRAFTRSNPTDLGEWAKEEGTLFDPGTLVFLLEPAKKPPGMTTFAKGQQGATEATPDAFRVKDMCVVVDKIDGKCWVLAISPSAFELRFIDTLFREKAQKSFLEGIDFNYLSAQPRPVLTPERLKELRQLSSLYSKSGSRRTLAQDESGPEEPAKAMLSFLGADLGPNAAKQVIELGLICNLIFSPEGEQENKTQSLVKSCFSPILSTDRLKGEAPSPPPTPTAKVIQSQELINEEVSLLTQAYLQNEAQEAEEYLKYAPPGQTAQPDTSQTSGVWTSQPAVAPTAPQGASGDEFKPLTGPPPAGFGNMGGFAPPANNVQPTLSLSPDIPSILTGEHPVIAVDQTLTKDTNGQSDKVPSLPAWYLTTHDVNEMNQVALRRAAEAPKMPDGLERLESELSYDSLPVVDVRFRGEGAPPAQEFNPAASPAAAEVPAPSTSAGQSGTTDWSGGGVGAGQVEKDFVDKIFETSGASTPSTEQPKRRAKDSQTPEEPAAPSNAFVSPGSLAIPQPTPAADAAKDSNLFERLGQGEQPVEEPSTPSFADSGHRGVPTNLKDMLTADSAVFSTSSSTRAPEPGISSSEFALPEKTTPEPTTDFSKPGPSPAVAPSVSPPGDTASSATDDSAPAPWMNLPHHAPAAEVAPEQPPEPASAVPTGATAELSTALNGLMDSSVATDKSEPGPAVSPAAAAEPQADLFTEVDVIDKVIDLAASRGESEKEPEPEIESDYFSDRRDMTIDLDAAFLKKMASGPATLTSPSADAEVVAPEREMDVVLPPAAAPSFDTPSLVSPAMAAHAQAMAEPVEDTPKPAFAADSPSSSITKEPTASSAPTSAEPEADSEPGPSSDLTPVRPRSRYRRGVPPRVTPDAEAESAPTEQAEPAAAVETSAELDQLPSSEPAAASVPASTEASTDFFGLSSPSSTETPTVSSEPAAATSEPVSDPVSASPSASDVSAPATSSADALPNSADSTDAPSASVDDAFFSSPEPSITDTASSSASADSPTVSPASSADSSPPPTSSASQDTPSTSPTFSPAVSSRETVSAEDDEATTSSRDSAPLTTPLTEPSTMNLEESGVFLSTDKDDDKPVPYGLDLKPLSASGLQRAQPSVEPKLVISESTRFMARLNQRLSEADKKLSSRCDQSRDRLNRELDALLDDARKVERQNELSTGSLTEQLVQHLETVSEEVKSSISKTSKDSRDEIQQLIKQAEENIEQMHKDMLRELELTESKFQDDTNSMSESTRANLNDHAQARLTDFNKKLEEITLALEGVYTHHINVLLARYGKFESRLNEEIDAIVSALDRNVGSMTVEIDGSWDRASEKLTASQSEFGNSVDYLVHSCRADIKQVHLDLYAKQVLPRLLENKDIFRSMLLDMKRNFEEQSEKVRRKQLSGLTGRIDDAKEQLNTLTKECLSTIESVGKGQQFGLEDLFKSTNTRLEEIISTVESRLKTAKQQILDNDEACMKTSESSRVEDEPAFSKEKQQAIAALNECRTKADNALETHISSSCLDLEQLSEQMQEDLAKQRQEWTAQVRVSADESIMQVKQALQDAFQAIETAKEKHME